MADLVATRSTPRASTRATVVGHSFGGLLAHARSPRAAPERVERLALLDPAVAVDARAGGAAEAEAARRDEGWADRGGGPRRPPARCARRTPRDTVDEDLATFLAEDPDGRVRLRFCRPAAITAWSEMARPAPSLAGYPGRCCSSPPSGPTTSRALRAALRRDLGGRLTERRSTPATCCSGTRARPGRHAARGAA